MKNIEDTDYISFNDIVDDNCIDGQVQYLSRHLYPCEDYVFLAENLRVIGEPGDYHGWIVHKDDVVELVCRFKNRSY